MADTTKRELVERISELEADLELVKSEHASEQKTANILAGALAHAIELLPLGDRDRFTEILKDVA